MIVCKIPVSDTALIAHGGEMLGCRFSLGLSSSPLPLRQLKTDPHCRSHLRELRIKFP
jgi:hypothetical protein